MHKNLLCHICLYTISDGSSLPGEIDHLKKTFWVNGYYDDKSLRALRGKKCTDKLQLQLVKTVFFTLTGNTSLKVSRILVKHQIRTIFCPRRNCSIFFLQKVQSRVFEHLFHRMLSEKYIGQTIWTVEEKKIEHPSLLQLIKLAKSALTENRRVVLMKRKLCFSQSNKDTSHSCLIPKILLTTKNITKI